MFQSEKYGPIVVPILTPFDDTGELDVARLGRLVDFVLESDNADAFVVSGTTGEFFSQTFAERVETFRQVKESAGDTPVIAGIGCPSTRETIALGEQARELGYETAMVVCPYYTKPTQNQLADHFSAVAAELPEMNIMLYNIPIFTGVNLEAETVSALAAIDNVVAIKDEAELNPKQITRFLNATSEDFIIYNGDDTMILESYAQGGTNRIGGVISGASHLLGRFIRDMIASFTTGDLAKAVAMQRSLYPVLRVMGVGGRLNPAPLWKDAVRLAGGDAGSARSPLSCGDAADIAEVRAVLERFASAWPGYVTLARN